MPWVRNFAAFEQIRANASQREAEMLQQILCISKASVLEKKFLQQWGMIKAMPFDIFTVSLDSWIVLKEATENYHLPNLKKKNLFSSFSVALQARCGSVNFPDKATELYVQQQPAALMNILGKN